MYFPGGFEEFFDEIGSEMLIVPPGSPAANHKMKNVMAKYGMEWLGPPLFKPLRYHTEMSSPGAGSNSVFEPCVSFDDCW